MSRSEMLLTARDASSGLKVFWWGPLLRTSRSSLTRLRSEGPRIFRKQSFHRSHITPSNACVSQFSSLAFFPVCCQFGKLGRAVSTDRKSTRLNSSHLVMSYVVY